MCLPADSAEPGCRVCCTQDIQLCSCHHYCYYHSIFATFRQAAATAASSNAATVVASLLTSRMISEYLMSLPSCTSAGFRWRINGRSLCSMLPAEATKNVSTSKSKHHHGTEANFQYLSGDNPMLASLEAIWPQAIQHVSRFLTQVDMIY